MPKSQETKRRLLLSKWRDGFDRSKLENRVGQLLAGVDSLNELVGKLAAQDEKIEQLEADLEEAREEIKSLEEGEDGRCDDLEQVLSDVKYWILDYTCHKRPGVSAEVMLRKVEDVL